MSNLYKHCLPIDDVNKNYVMWHWGLLQRKAFESLKIALCTMPLVINPNLSLPYTVVLDASRDVAEGALVQDQGEGLRLVTFMSRAFKPTE